jgi:hypothetical protein
LPKIFPAETERGRISINDKPMVHRDCMGVTSRSGSPDPAKIRARTMEKDSCGDCCIRSDIVCFDCCPDVTCCQSEIRLRYN